MPGVHEDSRLLLAVRRGSARDGAEAWRRYGPAVLRYAACLLGPGWRARQSPDDIAQAVFCRILKAPPATLRSVRDPLAWLLSLTRRLVLDELRAARRESHRVRRLPAHPGTLPREDPPRLSSVVDSLPRRQREALLLKHVAGLTFDQMALALGVPRSTAAARCTAAYASLARLLESRPLDAPTESIAELHP